MSAFSKASSYPSARERWPKALLRYCQRFGTFQERGCGLNVTGWNARLAAGAFYEGTEIMSGPLHFVELVRGDDQSSQVGMNVVPKELTVPIHGRQELSMLIFSLVDPPDVPMKTSAEGDLCQRGEKLLESRHSGIVPWQSAASKRAGERREGPANPADRADGNRKQRGPRRSSASRSAWKHRSQHGRPRMEEW